MDIPAWVCNTLAELVSHNVGTQGRIELLRTAFRNICLRAFEVSSRPDPNVDPASSHRITFIDLISCIRYHFLKRPNVCYGETLHSYGPSRLLPASDVPHWDTIGIYKSLYPIRRDTSLVWLIFESSMADWRIPVTSSGKVICGRSGLPPPKNGCMSVCSHQSTIFDQFPHLDKYGRRSGISERHRANIWW